MLQKIYGNAIVLAAAARRRGVAHAARDRLERIRDRRVRSLVRFAARTVPYYRDWFQQNGIDPRDIRTAADLECIPILEKETVRAEPERFRSTSRRGRRALHFRTSGSTGLPLEFWHDRRSIIENIAYSESERAVATGIIGRSHGYRTLSIARALTASRVREFTLANTFIPMRPSRRGLDVADPIDEVIDTIRKVRPEVVGGYGSYIEMLFRHIHDAGIDVPLPRLINYYSDGITLPGQRLIMDRLGIPLTSNYSATESFRIAFQCGHGPHFHLHEDLCHVRIMDEQGRDLPDGETGTIVISNLVNRGTVLFNYRLGDIGVVSSRSCRCGRNLRLLERLEGRTHDVVLLPNGNILHPSMVWSLLESAQGLLRYQLIQHEKDRLELKLVTRDEAAFEQISAREVQGFLDIIGGAARLDVTRVDELKPDASGKFHIVVSHSNPR